jgi:heme iron utilization protein
MSKPDPYLAADESARSLANTLLGAARHAALAVVDPETSTPNISRIAIARSVDGAVFTLVSQLSAHTLALNTLSACAFMVGEPGQKGDPLTHPRLMVQAQASFLSRNDPTHPTIRAAWLKHHPKSKLYIDFADFCFVCLTPQSAVLNAGFGRAYRLQPSDLRP